MNESQKPIVEIVAELEKQLFARGQSPNAISQYHYIFQVFLAFFAHIMKRTFQKNS